MHVHLENSSLSAFFWKEQYPLYWSTHRLPPLFVSLRQAMNYLEKSIVKWRTFKNTSIIQNRDSTLGHLQKCTSIYLSFSSLLVAYHYFLHFIAVLVFKMNHFCSNKVFMADDKENFWSVGYNLMLRWFFESKWRRGEWKIVFNKPIMQTK